MDGATTPSRSVLPAWLDGTLISSLARVAAAEIAAGCTQAAVARRVHEAALAYSPALPLPQIREAVAIALWVGGAADRP